MRFLTSIALTAVIMVSFLRWASEQSERQIGKMQDAVFNSPGAESPVPPGVIATGIGLLVGQWIVVRKVFRLKTWQTVVSLMVGGLLAAGVLLRFSGRSTS